MSWLSYQDECSDCRPAMVDAETGKRLPDDSPTMKVVLRLWGEMSRPERIAWHRFTCLNSRDILDLQYVKKFSDRIDAALRTGG